MEELEVTVLTIEIDGITDIYYLVRKDDYEVLVERSLSDTAEESVAITVNTYLQNLLRTLDENGIRSFVETEYGPGARYKVERYTGPKARILVEMLALSEIKPFLEPFLVRVGPRGFEPRTSRA